MTYRGKPLNFRDYPVLTYAASRSPSRGARFLSTLLQGIITLAVACVALYAYFQVG